MWQDWIMGLVGIVFAGGMVPTIRASMRDGKVCIPYSSLVVTVVGLLAITVCMATLSAWVACVANWCNCTCWMCLVILKHHYAKKEDKKGGIDLVA